MNDRTLLEVENLKVYYPVTEGMFKKKHVKAVDGVSFKIQKGEVFGIVGESGCGKSTLGKTICKLIQPTEGSIRLSGEELSAYSKEQMRPIRKKVQIIFQDPYASLDPRMTVFDIVAEAMIVHKQYSSEEELKEKVMNLLKVVGLNDYQAYSYPHEFSGGQRQRIGIARALAVNPQLIIADEPVSALDVSVQAQVLNLMNNLKKKYDLTYIFVAHDLSVVKFISDRVGVMYLGNFVEIADKKDLYANPLHPYTQALLAAVPIPNPRKRKKHIHLTGDIPSALNPPRGCKFHTRCDKCMEICTIEEPKQYQAGEGHLVYCHLYNERNSHEQ